MAIWHTWLGYTGLVLGLVAAAGFSWPPLRSALIGFVGGIGATIAVNLLTPGEPPCLQNAKGLDIIRAYSLNCAADR